jgi:hypothetical protein
VILVPVLRNPRAENPALTRYSARIEKGRVIVTAEANIDLRDHKKYETFFRAYVVKLGSD